jgi:tetratricopeptide (TPR) repeat protein
MLQLSNVFCSEGRTAQAEQMAARARNIAQEEGIGNLLTQGLIDLGNAFVQRKHLDEAEGYFHQALSLSQRYKGRRNEARALLSLGNIDVMRGNLDEARGRVEQALSFYQQGGYRTETLQALTILGLASGASGEYQVALNAFQNQLQVAEQANDLSQVAWANHGIGSALGSLEQYTKALDSFKIFVAINESQDMKMNVGYGLLNSADMLWRLGRYQEAQTNLAKAAAIADLPDKSYEQLRPIISSVRAKMLLSRRQYGDVKSESDQALRLATKEDKIALVEAKYVLGLSQSLSGATRAGRLLCEDAIKVANSAGDVRLLLDAHLALAEALLEDGDAKGGLSIALRLKEDCERNKQRDSLWRALLIAARAANSLGDEQKTQEYTAQADAVLSGLQRDLGAENYNSYLGRPDIQLRRKQLKELLAPTL